MNYSVIDLSKYFNNTGLATEDTYERASLTFAGSSIPKEDLPINKVFKFKGVPFILKTTNKGDNIEFVGQNIVLDSIYKGTHIKILGLSVYGNFYDYITLYNKGELKKKVKVCLSDCVAEEPSFGNIEVFKSSYMFVKNKKPPKNMLSFAKIWMDTIPFDSEISFDEIQFEDNPSMHIFSLTLQRGV